MPGASAVVPVLAMRCGPSWTERYDPMPCPVPWSKSRPARQSAARASASICAPFVPGGKTARATAMWPFSTRVKRSRMSGARPSDSDRAGDVGRAVFVLRAAVDEENAAIDFPIGLFADPIVRDRRIRASAGDGREREVLERRARSPERLQSLRPRRFRSGGPAAPQLANQARKFAIAAPSRSCAARDPASSAGFFFAFMSVIGSGPISALPPARSIAWVR